MNSAGIVMTKCRGDTSRSCTELRPTLSGRASTRHLWPALFLIILADPASAQRRVQSPRSTIGGVVRSAPMMFGPGKGVGVVTEVDEANGSITLKSGPIDALHWPAMTMKFKAKPELIKGLSVGQTISFSMNANGGSAEITEIEHG